MVKPARKRYISLKEPPGQADIIYIGNNNPRRKMMLTIASFIGMFVGFEGYLNGKLYVGVYTPKCEYGYVITQEEIYLDTIYEKR